ncbi:hypothetical protein N9C37_01520 [Planktomarina temperata]|nr:hypothetical protein [Planktomarina temperata]
MDPAAAPTNRAGEKKHRQKKPNPKDSAVAIIFPNKIATAINNKVLPVVSFIVAEVPSPIISG